MTGQLKASKSSTVIPSNETLVSSHLRYVQRLLDELNAKDMLRIAQLLRPFVGTGKLVYVAGNGGSAANASHFAAHLCEERIFAVCLTDNIPLFTAKSNDYSYGDALRLMLPNLAPPVAVVVFSTSGNSANIFKLLTDARTTFNDVATIGFLGNRGGRAADLCDIAITLSSTASGAVEDAHSTALHAIVGSLLCAW